MQLYGPSCGNTISVQIYFAPLSSSYDKVTSAVQMNGSIGEWFRTTVGIRQGCLLSPTLPVSGLPMTDALAEKEQELEAPVESLDKTCTRFKMEISAEKTRLVTNSANGIQRELQMSFVFSNTDISKYPHIKYGLDTFPSFPYISSSFISNY